MIGENAIDRLTGAIDTLRANFGTEELPIDPVMDPIIEESIAFYEPEAGADATRQLYRYPTINLGVIEGGTAINTVPAEASARVDIRLTAGVEPETALTAIRSCLGDAAGIGIADVSWTEGSFVPLDSPIATSSARAADSVVEDEVFRRSATGGGDAKTLRRIGIPTVEFGFGTQSAHGVEEYTTREALARNVTAYALIPYELQEEPTE
jgi:succinyl-diaminopimelate desuccinylase